MSGYKSIFSHFSNALYYQVNLNRTWRFKIHSLFFMIILHHFSSKWWQCSTQKKIKGKDRKDPKEPSWVGLYKNSDIILNGSDVCTKKKYSILFPFQCFKSWDVKKMGRVVFVNGGCDILSTGLIERWTVIVLLGSKIFV